MLRIFFSSCRFSLYVPDSVPSRWCCPLTHPCGDESRLQKKKPLPASLSTCSRMLAAPHKNLSFFHVKSACVETECWTSILNMFSLRWMWRWARWALWGRKNYCARFMLGSFSSSSTLSLLLFRRCFEKRNKSCARRSCRYVRWRCVSVSAMMLQIFKLSARGLQFLSERHIKIARN